MDNNTSTSGLGLTSVLTIIFVVLKLVGVINWSWWWVLSPVLIDLSLALILIVGYAIYKVYDNKKYGTAPKKGKKDKWKF